MTEVFWIIEAFRVLLSGGSFDDLRQREGFVLTLCLLGALIPASIIGWGMGLDTWRETPLARWFGLGGDQPERDIGAIDAELKQYETWRDLDGDGRRDF